MTGLQCLRRPRRGDGERTGQSTESDECDAGGNEGGSEGKGIVAHGQTGFRNCHRLHS